MTLMMHEIKHTVKPVKDINSQKDKNGFQDQLSPNAGQKYSRREHSAILSTFIKLPFVF